MLEDELQLLSSLYHVSKTPLSQLAVNAYVAYVDQVTSLTAPCGMCEVHSLMAVALHVRLNLWVSNVLLQTSPESGKAASKATKVGRWLEFCCLAVGSLYFSFGCNALQFVTSVLHPCCTHEAYMKLNY